MKSINQFILFLLCFQFLGNVSAQNRKLLEFQFSGNVDELSSKVKGVLQNNISFTEDRYGNSKSAIKLNGVNSFLKIPFDINAVRYPEMTVMLWVKTDRTEEKSVIFSNDNGGYDRSIYIDNRGDYGSWKYSAFCGNGAVLAGKKPIKNKWTFITCTFNQRTGENILFIDDEVFSKIGRHDQGLDFFHLGSNPTYGGSFSGTIDDFRIFKGVLTQSEIKKIYESEASKIYVPTELKQQHLSKIDSDAEIVIRVGDIDNLGFGFPENFDPFSGNSTPIHPYPWKTDYNDYLGTDKISISGSYIGGYVSRDGYTNTTSRPSNYPSTIVLKFPKIENEIRDATIQMFVDDFQSPYLKSYFQVRLNGKRISYIEEVINSLNQTGPIGKLISIGMLPEDLILLKEGVLEISINDETTGIGDGFAIDFVRLLINRKDKSKHLCEVTGIVTDYNGNPISSVFVSSSGIKNTITDLNGRFKLSNIPAGLVNVSAKKIGYDNSSIMTDIVSNQSRNIKIILSEKSMETEEVIKEQLSLKGRMNLYGILFDSDEDIPKSKSEQSLNSILQVLNANNKLKLRIIGHTDSDGKESYNQDLSNRRAKSIVAWLVKNGVSSNRLIAIGKGEMTPVASNIKEEGKALNRRVELEVIKE